MTRRALAILLAAPGRLADLLDRLAGPILTKELRVTSRRRRYYALRSGYVILLALFLGHVWDETLRGYNAGGYAWQVAVMAEMARQTVVTIVIFQFAVSVFLAPVLVGPSISDEIRRRTLGVLMTTPVSSRQIVLGKLAGRMLPIVLLLAISLPVLGVIRVLGGVPWGFLVAGLCLTLCTVAFYASVAMVLSTRAPGTIVVAILTHLICATLLFLLPCVVAWGLGLVGPFRHGNQGLLLSTIMDHANPFTTLSALTEEAQNPGSRPYVLCWPISCGVALGLAAVTLALAAFRVRREGLYQPVGGQRSRGARAAAGPQTAPSPLPAVPRRARAWRVPRNTIAALVIGGGAVMMGCLNAYVFGARFDEPAGHLIVVLVCLFVASFYVAVTAAATIPREKETRSWPILLTTPMSKLRLVLWLARGITRRSLLVWSMLLTYLGVFTLLGYIHPVALLHVLLAAAAVHVILTAFGLMLGTVLTRSTWAVLLNLLLAGWLWLGALLWPSTPPQGFNGWQDAEGYVLCDFSPTCQALLTMKHASGLPQARQPLQRLRYIWTSMESPKVGFATLLVGSTAAFHLLVAALLLLIASALVRRNVF